MNEQLTDVPTEISGDGRNSPWRNSLVLLALLLVGWCVAYWSSLVSIVGIWWINDTFNHGFFILPISGWLIWRSRLSLRVMVPQPCWYGVALVGGLSALWLVAELVAIQAAQHLAVVSMIPALVLTVLGWKVAKAIWFPLFFLLFAAPVGDFLIPPLMELTAWFAISLLHLTNFPVFREGMYFTIPSGSFEVAAACSGISYLIASVVLGSVYAHISYRDLWRKALFMLMSVLVPLVANGFRAYGIVLLAHYSGYELAVGFDHLIYGALFFGVVMFILFGLGNLWRQSPEQVGLTDNDEEKTETVALKNDTPTTLLLLGLLPLIAILIGPGFNFFVFSTSQSSQQAVYASSMLPDDSEQVKLLASVNTDWSPKYVGASKTELATYQYKEQVFSIYVASYINQQQGAELISQENTLYDPESWRPLNTAIRRVGQSDQVSSLEYKDIKLSNGRKERLIAYWYQIGDESVVSPVKVKLYEAWNKLNGVKGSAIVVVAMDYRDDVADVPEKVKEFITYMSPKINQQLKLMRSEL